MAMRELGEVVYQLHERACRKVWGCGFRDPGLHVSTVGRSLGQKTCHGPAVCMAGNGKQAAVDMNVGFELSRKEEAVEGCLHKMAQRMTRDGGL